MGGPSCRLSSPSPAKRSLRCVLAGSTGPPRPGSSSKPCSTSPGPGPVADEPVLADVPPNGLHDWAVQRVASALAPTVWGAGALLRAAAQPGRLYLRVNHRGSVWAWRPDNPHRPAVVARAGKLKAIVPPGGDGKVWATARLGELWLTAHGVSASTPHPRTVVVSDTPLWVRTELPDVFRGR